MYAVPEAIVEVRVKITTVDRRQAVPTLEDTLHRPHLRLDSTGSIRSAVIRNAIFRVVGHPLLRNRNARIGVNSVVAEEVQSYKQGDRTLPLVREVDQDLHGRIGVALGEGDGCLGAGGLTAECPRLEGMDRRAERRRGVRRLSIHFPREEL